MIRHQCFYQLFIMADHDMPLHEQADIAQMVCTHPDLPMEQADVPVVFANETEAKQFIKDSGIPEKQTVLVGTDNKEWFMPGDNVYQVTKTEEE